MEASIRKGKYSDEIMSRSTKRAIKVLGVSFFRSEQRFSFFVKHRTHIICLPYIQRMIDPKYVKFDKKIPTTLIRHCEGIAFITIIKAGLFFLGGNIGMYALEGFLSNA